MTPLPSSSQDSILLLITGLPGVGKTTLGRTFSASHHTEWFDLDEEMCRRYSSPGASTVRQIYQEMGESSFRTMERVPPDSMKWHEGQVVTGV